MASRGKDHAADRRRSVLSLLRCLQERNGGVIPVESFMAEALYHPRLGYYTSTIRDVGGKGDFSTSATLDAALPPAIADWIAGQAGAYGWKRPTLIECGAGTGELAKRILSALDRGVRRRLRYRICETSPVLRRIQRRKLMFAGVRWRSSVSEALRECGGEALLISNELVDAFPCKVFMKGDRGAWRELGLRLTEEGSLSETPFGPEYRGGWFLPLDHLPPGHRIERHDSHDLWMGEWIGDWKKGRSLTIDYGETGEGLAQRPPEGTLRAYWRHQRFHGLQAYARFGLQDMTADVNFSDLIRRGESRGLSTLRCETQGEFVSGGNPRRISTLGEAAERFLVLEQERTATGN